MVEAGILSEDDRVELIEGELIEMAPKGDDHESLKDPLVMRLARALPDPLSVSVETTLKLSADTYVEPDVLIYDSSHGRAGLGPDTVLLAIEIAASSLAYDLGRKPDLYARHGVRELWVVDVKARCTTIHKGPSEDGYAHVSKHDEGDALSPLLIPDLTLKLSDLK